jgi:hypothetical protein
MARAHIRVELGDRMGALEDLNAWVEAHPSLLNYWYLSLFRRQVGDRAGSILALSKATGYGVIKNPDAYCIPECSVCEAAFYAYECREFSLALQLADIWESFGGEPSYHGIRAAALLALGAYEEAESAVSLSIEAESQRGTWFDGQEALKAAIESRQQTYRHPMPGACHVAYEDVLFIDYE